MVKLSHAIVPLNRKRKNVHGKWSFLSFVLNKLWRLSFLFSFLTVVLHILCPYFLQYIKASVFDSALVHAYFYETIKYFRFLSWITGKLKHL
jgi:hypothetical protein